MESGKLTGDIHSLLNLYQNYSLDHGPVVQENCWSPQKVSGPSQDEFVEYVIYNTKMQ